MRAHDEAGVVAVTVLAHVLDAHVVVGERLRDGGEHARAVGQHRLAGTRGPGESTYAHLEVRPVGDAVTRYYVNLEVSDRPGVLAAVAQAFADHGVSIQNVRQDGHGDDAGLVVRTHTARDSDLAATIERLRSSDSVRRVVGVMRVEGEGER